jgi:sigma-B regulation protein RsbU (phosphoserine phosphatase)
MSVYILFCLLAVLIGLQAYLWVITGQSLQHEKRAVSDREEVVEFLSRFVNSIATSSDPRSWMREIAGSVSNAINAANVRIYLLDTDSQLHLTAQAGSLPILAEHIDFKTSKATRLLEQIGHDHIEIGDGFVGEVALTGENYLAGVLDITTHSGSTANGRSHAVESVMAVPMSINEQRIGVICAVNKRDKHKSFTADDLFLLSTLSSHVAIGGVLTQVYEEMSEQQRILQELLLARDIQNSLLPEAAPTSDNFEIHAINQAALEVSGDYYDFIEVDDDLLLVLIADASGKGIPACMFTAMCRSFVRSNVERYKDDLEGLLHELNGALFADVADDGKFITIALCLIDRRDNTVEYARAGHTELLIRSAEGEVMIISPDGPALGLLPNEFGVDFDTFAFSWLPNTSLLMYTDGITEALNEKMEEFGLDRLVETWKEVSANPETAAHQVLAAVEAHADSYPQTDDRTLVILSR